MKTKKKEEESHKRKKKKNHIKGIPNVLISSALCCRIAVDAKITRSYHIPKVICNTKPETLFFISFFIIFNIYWTLLMPAAYWNTPK